MKPKAILFDAGDVLYHRPNREARLRAFLSELGLPLIPRSDPRRQALRRQAHAGQISEAELYDAILKLCGVDDPTVREQGKAFLSESTRCLTYFPKVAETLHRLKAAGFRLGVVTNTFNPTEEKLAWFRKAGFDTVWDSFATSCELGVLKPDPRIYLAATEPLGIEPHEAAFVGHAQYELDGAKALGMITIAFNRDDDTVRADHIIEDFADLLCIFDIEQTD